MHLWIILAFLFTPIVNAQQEIHFIDAHTCRDEFCCEYPNGFILVTITFDTTSESVHKDIYITEKEWERLKEGKDIAIIPGRCVPLKD